MSKLLFRVVYQRITFEIKKLILKSQAIIFSRRAWNQAHRQWQSHSLSKSTSTGKVTVLEGSSLLLTSCKNARIPTSDSPKTDSSPYRRPKPYIPAVIFTAKARTSIFGERKVFDSHEARRVTLHLVTSLLTQYDSDPEKLTFIQNSLLFLYIDKKSEN